MLKMNNAEFSNELCRQRNRGGLDLKNESHYFQAEEWPLLDTNGTHRSGGLTTHEPPTSGVTGVAGNHYKVDDHIVPLSVKTPQYEKRKDMEQHTVVEIYFFRDRTHSTSPLPVLGAWLDKLLLAEMRRASKQMQLTVGEGPPTTQSQSIMIKALNGIDSKGQTV